jgi:lysozyme
MVNRTRMQAQLVLHEGLRTHAYLDTVGKWTVGVGYNLSDRGVDFLEKILGRRFNMPFDQIVLTHDEALKVLDADIDRFEKAVVVHFPFYTKLIEVRQRVVLDMAFNMGFAALGFVNTRKMVEAQDWSGAARGLYNSKWARQVGDGPDDSPEAAKARGRHFDRCDRLSRMLLTGKDYTV